MVRLRSNGHHGPKLIPGVLEQGRILVPVDLTRRSIDALRTVIESTGPDTTVHALHVLADVETKAAHIRKVLAPDGRAARVAISLREQLPEVGIDRVEVVVRSGDSDEAIAQMADELQCDLIVISREAKGWLSRALSGSVTERLVRRAQCPVLVLSPGASSLKPGGRGRGSRARVLRFPRRDR